MIDQNVTLWTFVSSEQNCKGVYWLFSSSGHSWPVLGWTLPVSLRLYCLHLHSLVNGLRMLLQSGRWRQPVPVKHWYPVTETKITAGTFLKTFQFILHLDVSLESSRLPLLCSPWLYSQSFHVHSFRITVPPEHHFLGLLSVK
jgi:hypothetical protein